MVRQGLSGRVSDRLGDLSNVAPDGSQFPQDLEAAECVLANPSDAGEDRDQPRIRLMYLGSVEAAREGTWFRKDEGIGNKNLAAGDRLCRLLSGAPPKCAFAPVLGTSGHKNANLSFPI